MTPATSSTTTPATSSTTQRRRWPWILLGVVLGGLFVLGGLVVLGVIAYMRELRERPVIPVFRYPPPERFKREPAAEKPAGAKEYDA